MYEMAKVKAKKKESYFLLLFQWFHVIWRNVPNSGNAAVKLPGVPMQADILGTTISLFQFVFWKEYFDFEMYFDLIPYKLKSCVSRINYLHISLHIWSGRYGQNRVDWSERYCEVCNRVDIDDELHLIIAWWY